MDPAERLRYQSKEQRKALLVDMVTTELLSREAIDRGYEKEFVTRQQVRTALRAATVRAVHDDAKELELRGRLWLEKNVQIEDGALGERP